jgi:ABC-type multidrug transport system fused ATPase/permease subunit
MHCLQLSVNMLYMCVTSISIGFHLNGVTAAKNNTKDLCEILNESPTIECDQNRHKESIMKPKGKGAIRFDNVFFAYPSRPDIEVSEQTCHNPSCHYYVLPLVFRCSRVCHLLSRLANIWRLLDRAVLARARLRLCSFASTILSVDR